MAGDGEHGAPAPGSAAPSLALPAGVPASTSSGRRSPGRPAQASASSHGRAGVQVEQPGPRGERQLGHLLAAESRARPTRPRSASARAAASGRLAQPAQLGQRAQRRWRAGRCAAVNARRRGRRRAPAPRRRRAASCQAIAGGAGRRAAASSSTPVSAMLVTPMPRTRPSGARSSASRAASTDGAEQRVGVDLGAGRRPARQGVGAGRGRSSTPVARRRPPPCRPRCRRRCRAGGRSRGRPRRRRAAGDRHEPRRRAGQGPAAWGTSTVSPRRTSEARRSSAARRRPR